MNPSRDEVIFATQFYEPELFPPGCLVAQIQVGPNGLEIMTDEGWQGAGNGVGRVMGRSLGAELPEYTAPRPRMTLVDVLLVSGCLGIIWTVLGTILVRWW